MFAKIFSQIFDSSIADDWQVRHVFEDLLKLCDITGVVDATHEAIARRTNVPIEIVRRAIAELEKPDPRSRNPDNEGRRLARLDPHRDWGWIITNYSHYRAIASEEQRREQTRARVQRFRERNADVTVGALQSVTVTAGNAGNAMQKQKQIKKKNFTPTKKSSTKLMPCQREIADRYEDALGDQWVNDAGKWINRIKTNVAKCERVIAEVQNAVKESRVKTSAAQYAEHVWREFK